MTHIQMRISLFVLAAFLTLSVASCKTETRTDISTDSLTANDQAVHHADTILSVHEPKVDTAQTAAATTSTAPTEYADPIEPAKLVQYLPSLLGFETEGDIERETRIQKDMKMSRVEKKFSKGDKKVALQINDFDYVPSLYTPFTPYQSGRYLQDDNEQRTETTTIGGYNALQTWEKNNHSATIFVFPGKRFVVRLVGDNLDNVAEARDYLARVDLKGLEQLEAASK